MEHGVLTVPAIWHGIRPDVHGTKVFWPVARHVSVWAMWHISAARNLLPNMAVLKSQDQDWVDWMI